MHSFKTDYAITEACGGVMNTRLKSALFKEIVTPLIDSLAFLGLDSSDSHQFRKDYLKSTLPEKKEQWQKMYRQKLEFHVRD